MRNDFVSVDDRVTNDLGSEEEKVFEVIALNPDEPASKILEKYDDLSERRLVEVVDSLSEQGFVRRLREPSDEGLVWEVTDIGRLMLLKYVEVMRFDVMEAQLRGMPVSVVEDLKRKRKAFETAYRQCKVLFEDE
jgi:DNA-binding MarR family transcriptional regulator